MAAKRVAILISGSGSNMESLIKDMQAGDHPGQPVGVISNNPDAGGLARAQALGVSALVVPHKGRDKESFETDLHQALIELKPDLILLAGFMRILSPPFVEKWPGKILNIHPSILPLFKGLNTHAQALAAGVAIHGATVHEVTPRLDNGQIIGQTAIAIAPHETAETLATRLLPLEHRLYCKSVRAFLNNDPLPIAIIP